MAIFFSVILMYVFLMQGDLAALDGVHRDPGAPNRVGRIERESKGFPEKFHTSAKTAPLGRENPEAVPRCFHD